MHTDSFPWHSLQLKTPQCPRNVYACCVTPLKGSYAALCPVILMKKCLSWVLLHCPHYSRLFSGMQATARTYEDTLEEAVETVEEKLLLDRQRSEEEEDRIADLLRQEQLQAWDTELDRDSKSKKDDG